MATSVCSDTEFDDTDTHGADDATDCSIDTGTRSRFDAAANGHFATRTISFSECSSTGTSTCIKSQPPPATIAITIAASAGGANRRRAYAAEQDRVVAGGAGAI